MSAKVSTFGQGVTYVATGETGTQANEFEAAIKSVTSATTVGAVFVYDTRNDSDSGAWRKKARGSWYDETLNTATRGGRREFPSVALIVADNDSSTRTVTIYDLDDPAMPMWLQFSGNNTLLYSTVNEITALNGRIYLGQNLYGAVIYDFVNDKIGRYRDNVANGGWKLPSSSIADRATTHSGVTGTFNAIVNSNVNDVAATIVEGSEIGALGLPIPTVAVATDGGVSVIHPNGSVYDQTYTQNNNNKSGHVFWDDEGGLFFSTRESTNWVYLAYENQTLYSDKSSAPTKVFSPTTSSTGAVNFLGGNPVIAASRLSGSGFAVGGSLGLSLFKTNKGNPSESAVAYITSTYNTGYMLGDIRFAGLSGSGESGDIAADRSVKSHTLTKHGTGITDPVVATDAELRGITGFSASSYLSKAHTSDFDFGTGDFSVMFWCNLTASSNNESIVARYASDSASPDWLINKKGSTNRIGFLIDATDIAVSAQAVTGRWAQVCVLRRGSNVEIYIDGKRDGTGTNSANLTNTSATLAIGVIPLSSPVDPLSSTSSLSLVRISATAPTPQQVKEMYEAEKPLFRSGAKCLLSQVSFNDVNDLAYDNSSDLLYVGTKSGDAGDSVSTFRGLERVDTKDGQDLGWDGASANLVAAAGGVVGYARTGGTGGLVLDLPPFDVRGDTNIADTKLPDDGKIHFSGVTTDATPTVIGSIPIAEGENYLLNIRIRCNKYQKEATNRATYEIKQSVRRNIGYNVVAEADSYKLTDESVAGMDAVVESNTTSQTANLKVTGSSGIRIVWNATVEVQRISEKQYER